MAPFFRFSGCLGSKIGILQFYEYEMKNTVVQKDGTTVPFKQTQFDAILNGIFDVEHIYSEKEKEKMMKASYNRIFNLKYRN